MDARKIRAAFHKIKKQKLLSPARFEVYAALMELGPSTAGEVTQYLSTAKTANPSYHRRLAELERLGVVSRTMGFMCSVSGRKAIVWRVNGELPAEKMLPRAPKGLIRETLYLGLAEVYFLIHRYRRVNPNYSSPQHLDDLCRWLARRGAAMSARA